MEFISMFEEPGQEVEAEARERVVTAAQVEAQEMWPFLALAQTEEEFGHRMALAEPNLTSIAAKHGVEVEVITDPFRKGFEAVLAGRVEASPACQNCGHANPPHRKGGQCGSCGCDSYQPKARQASLEKQADGQRGPSYNPQSLEDLPLHEHGYNRQYQYSEGYDHGRAGTAYKGYGSRDKAIAYGHGYEHGKADAGGEKTASATTEYGKHPYPEGEQESESSDPGEKVENGWGKSQEDVGKEAAFNAHIARLKQALMEGQNPLEWIPDAPGGPQYAEKPGGHNSTQAFEGEEGSAYAESQREASIEPLPGQRPGSGNFQHTEDCRECGAKLTAPNQSALADVSDAHYQRKHGSLRPF